MKKVTTVEQRTLKSKTGKGRKGMFKFTKERIEFSTGKEEDPQAIKDMFDYIVKTQKSTKDMIMEHINNQEDLAKRVIRKAGLDPDDNEAIARRKKAREPEGYAGDILFHARQLRREIENNDLFGALYSGLKMEEAYGSFNLAQHELEILIGDDFMSQAGEGIKYSDEDKNRWRSIYDDVTADGQKRTKTWIRDRIIKKLGLPREARRSVYNWIGEQQAHNHK